MCSKSCGGVFPPRGFRFRIVLNSPYPGGRQVCTLARPQGYVPLACAAQGGPRCALLAPPSPSTTRKARRGPRGCLDCCVRRLSGDSARMCSPFLRSLLSLNAWVGSGSSCRVGYPVSVHTQQTPDTQAGGPSRGGLGGGCASKICFHLRLGLLMDLFARPPGPLPDIPPPIGYQSLWGGTSVAVHFWRG